MIIEHDAVGRDGLFSLTSEDAAVVDRVDAAVLEWAAEQGAAVERHPELFTVSQLARIDYFDSFPQLAHRVTPWLRQQGNSRSEDRVLTSAACYGVYFARAGAVVDDLVVVTVRQTCRRRENEYQLRRRQREFQMREVVALGTEQAVEAFLSDGKAAIRRIADLFSVAGEFGVATDPFFRKDDPRLLHQRLFPTKQEFVDTSGLAIASVNSHRNFFGERCDVRLADGTPISTGCVAFGLERWADAVGRSGRPLEKLGRASMSITGERPVTGSGSGSVAGSVPGRPQSGVSESGVSESEVVGRQWSKRVNVAKLWAIGMQKPMIRRAFWQLAYGTDAREFVYQWERLADEPAGTRVLDVPSGSGVFLLGLTPESRIEYTSVDISDEMVARVRAAAAEAGLTNVTALCADATKLPMPDGSFDLLLTYNGLHCFNEPWTALAEFRRVLAPGGRIRGTILIRRPGVVAPRAQRYFQFRQLLGPIGTWAQVQAWFAGAGLSVERVRQNGALAFFEGKAV